MLTKDILLYASADGGEMSIIANDLALTEIILQQAYLAMFGGNVEANTIGNEIETQERFDYWQNSLFFLETQSKQFNSNTERTLLNTVLNSSGRLKIQRAVESDISYLSNIVDFTVSVSILSTNKVEIEIKFTKKTNLEDKILILVYDNARNEVIEQRII